VASKVYNTPSRYDVIVRLINNKVNVCNIAVESTYCDICPSHSVSQLRVPMSAAFPFLGKVVGRGLVVGPTLIVLVEGETALSKCLDRGFDSLAWQHSIPGP
jgi:hypothetical protein